MKKFLLTVLMLCSFSSLASLNSCDIFNGKVRYCGSWAQSDSTPVSDSDGVYRDCRVFNGQVSSCGSWSQTESHPVLQSDGFYHDCRIFNGRVSSCGGWFQGKAIVEN